ncbi:hypothetical protein [Acetobacterium wieringae]|uniref:hypothetical protein n=1 Tax=Acetobacterium wieringae TaxID=52694 RepID=UPI002B1EBE98|nr:hypothetical protein [Acetobacterium wieringae]MEA4805110.1 hypothetical protein [Acetobacterium wieringae]
MSFYRDTVRTARKEHKCNLCGAIIRKGEKYHDKAGNDPDMWDSKECEKCQPVLNEFCSSDHYDRSEGYCEEWIQEWWLDEKCYACKHRYPVCKPDASCGNPKTCSEINKHGRCTGGDTCDDMTHYCRCEKFEVDNDQGVAKDPQQEVLQE